MIYFTFTTGKETKQSKTTLDMTAMEGLDALYLPVEGYTFQGKMDTEKDLRIHVLQSTWVEPDPVWVYPEAGLVTYPMMERSPYHRWEHLESRTHLQVPTGCEFVVWNIGERETYILPITVEGGDMDIPTLVLHVRGSTGDMGWCEFMEVLMRRLIPHHHITVPRME